MLVIAAASSAAREEASRRGLLLAVDVLHAVAASGVLFELEVVQTHAELAQQRVAHVFELAEHLVLLLLEVGVVVLLADLFASWVGEVRELFLQLLVVSVNGEYRSALLPSSSFRSGRLPC